MGRPAAAVVPLILWNPATDSEWTFRGAIDERTGRENTLWDLFDFVEREWHSRPEFSAKRRWTVKHVRELCERARLPEAPKVGNIIGWVEWLRTLYEETTVYLYWSTLRTVFELGAKAGFSRGNPAFPLALAKPVGRPHHIKNIGELWAELMAACETVRERAFVGVQRYAGLRRGEALGLEARDLRDTSEGPELLVRRQRIAPNTWQTKATKGKRARNVPVGPELEKLLREAIALGPAQVKVGRGGQRVIESEFLFPFREQDLTRLGERLREAAPEAFPRGHKMWHALRDTFAIEMYENGADISTIRDWLGHSTETVTHQCYIGNVAARVSRASLRFVGAGPPQAKAPAAAAATATTGARSGAPTAATVEAPRRSTEQFNSREERTPCSTPSRKRQSRSEAQSSSSPTEATRAPASPGRTQRSLPGLAVVAVTTRPARAAAPTPEKGHRS